MQRTIRTFFDMSEAYYVVAERETAEHRWKTVSVHRSLDTAESVLKLLGSLDDAEDEFDRVVGSFLND